MDAYGGRHHLAGEVECVALGHGVAGFPGFGELNPNPVGVAGADPAALISRYRLHLTMVEG